MYSSNFGECLPFFGVTLVMVNRRRDLHGFNYFCFSVFFTLQMLWDSQFPSSMSMYRTRVVTSKPSFVWFLLIAGDCFPFVVLCLNFFFPLSFVWLSYSVLCLRFCSGEFHCALYGEYVSRFQGTLSTSSEGLPIVVIQFAKIIVDKGLYFVVFLCFVWKFWSIFSLLLARVVLVQSVDDVSVLMLNLEIAEAVYFRLK